jgi:hypothetical protein
MHSIELQEEFAPIWGVNEIRKACLLCSLKVNAIQLSIKFIAPAQ